ncbi:MAG: hypothetical protein IJP52_00520 [Paludibacteraceae bacterium]|nr:hypothetical protein [Paludibacteraceae bacterium]
MKTKTSLPVRYILLWLLCRNALLMHAAWIPQTTNFSVRDYRAGTQNWALAQQRNGWIYVGNNYGMMEYDGSRWAVHGLPNSSTIHSIWPAQDGTLYVGATNDFGRFLPDDIGEWSYQSMADSVPEHYRGFGEVWNIQRLGTRLCVQTRRYLFLVSDNGHVEVIDPMTVIDQSVVAGESLYVSTSRGIYILSGGRLYPLSGARVLDGLTVCKMVPYGAHEVLIGTDVRGLFIYDGETVRPFRTDVDDFLHQNQLYSVAVNDRFLALGTVRHGIVLLTREGRKVCNLDKENGLQNNTILSLMFDHWDNLWAGMDYGVVKIDLSEKRRLLHDPYVDYGAGYTAIEWQGEYYIGTNQGLYRTNDKGTVTFVPGSHGQVWRLCAVGNTLMCCHNRGLFIVRPSGLIPVSTDDGFWNVLPWGDHYYLAGSYSGFYLLEQRHSNAWIVRHLSGIETSALFYDIDAYGHIWLSHKHQLWCLTLHPSTLELDVKPVQQAAGASFSLFRWGDQLLFAARGTWYEPDSVGQLVPASQWESLLPAARCRYAAMDAQRNIWYMADGRFLIRPYDSANSSYGEQAYEVFNDPSAFIDGFVNLAFLSDGSALMGGTNGFCRVSYLPSEREEQDRVVIRSVLATAPQRQLIGAQTMPGEWPELELPHADYSLRVDFAANNATRNHVRFRSRLMPIEQDFSPWSATPYRELTALPAGRYTLLVEMTTASEQIAQTRLIIHIARPWYRMWWAYLLYIALVVLIIVVLYLHVRRTIRINRARIETEKNAEIRSREVEILSLQHEKTRYELKNKSQQLSTVLLTQVSKNEVIVEVQTELRRIADLMTNGDTAAAKQRLIQLQNALNKTRPDIDWKQFEENFDFAHDHFVTKLHGRYPKLTQQERKLCVYIYMGLLTKEIAPLMNISTRGVEMMRYRVRKKMDLDVQANIRAFLTSIASEQER